MSTHTPGPWILGETSHDILARRGNPVASPCDGYDEDQWLIDGQLIAAAPDLLASAKEFVALCGGVTDAVSAGVKAKVERALAAIAKAEGR